MFKADKYQEYKDKNPDMKVADITKSIAHEWEKQPEEVKKRYEDTYAKSKKLYEDDMKEYKAKWGEPERKKKAKKDKKDKKDKKEKKAKKEKKEKKAKKEEKVVEKVAEKAKEDGGKKSANSKK